MHKIHIYLFITVATATAHIAGSEDQSDALMKDWIFRQISNNYRVMEALRGKRATPLGLAFQVYIHSLCSAGQPKSETTSRTTV